MSSFARYLLFQIPGWALAAIVLVGLVHWFGLSRWVATGLLVLWVIKDFVFYPFVRKAYETNVKTGSAQLIGAQGVAKQWLRPTGYVQVHGQLWRAEAESGSKPIAPETPIRVSGANGLTLFVVADQKNQS
ncbi:MAG: NfeD family protein [Candidatus Binatia bacterium]